MGSVVGLAFLLALNPVRLGVILLVVSRPRPVPNLLAYWAGCLMMGVAALLVPLTLLHGTPRFKSFAHDWGAPSPGSTVRHIQIGMGVVGLSIAALMTVRSLTRRRRQGRLPTPVGNMTNPMPNSNTPAPMSWLLGRAQEDWAEGGSAMRRLFGRARDAWQSGSLWVALAIGVLLGGPSPDVVFFVLAIIVGSGAAVGMQVSAAIAFVVGLLAVVEIILVSYVAAPTKTQAALRLLHDWAWAHRRQILVAVFAVVGISLVTKGMGSA